MSSALLLAAAVAFAAPADDLDLTPGAWPMFRGPNGVGVGADPLPADLIRPENLRWQVDVPGRGWGSPVVADGPEGPTVYVPTATPDGTQMDVLAYDLATGEERWVRKLFTVAEPDFTHPTNTYASCTPVATRDVVFVHFGKYGTAALDTKNGHTLWERRDFECDHFRGPASSPLLVQFDGLSPRLIVPFDGVGEDDQYVVALDAATGETLWRTGRDPEVQDVVPDLRKAYGTPVLAEVGDRTLVVTTGAIATDFLDPATGERVWRVKHGGMNSGSAPQVLQSPLGVASDAVLVTTGDAPTSLALLATDSDLTQTKGAAASDPALAWSSNAGAPKRATPLLLSLGQAVTVDDGGVASMVALGSDVDGDGGEVLSRVRLGDSYWSSPVRAGGTIFTFGKEGAATTLETGVFRGGADAPPELKVAHKSTLDEGVWATPALVGGGLVLRTEHTLRFYHPDGTNE
ncbi:outer membrane protein assembly factor BamB family protein [Alienimonas californiensis]|nr:PQQ-binding-like beta-propeller repeat protein [Alienimonas californiensis]